MFCVCVNVSAQNDSVKKIIKQTELVVDSMKPNEIYGIVSKSKTSCTVNTPFGKFDIEKENGKYSFMGMWGRIKSKKGSIYIIESSLGQFKIDTKKCTIIKL